MNASTLLGAIVIAPLMTLSIACSGAHSIRESAEVAPRRDEDTDQARENGAGKVVEQGSGDSGDSPSREPASPGSRDTLIGDPGGFRSDMKSRGVTLEISYIGDLVANLTGGLDRGAAYLGNVDLTLELDLEAMGVLPGATVFAHALSSHRTDSPTERSIGDLQVVSNIDAPEETRLYELWFEQRLFDDRLSFLIGQHDLNSEFAASEHAALFLNSSFGIQPDIAGNVPLSIFPVAGLAALVRGRITDWLDVRAAVYDGDPGDPEVNDTGTRWSLGADEGALIIGEVGLHLGAREGRLPGTLRIGGWYHTADFEDLASVDTVGDPVEHEGNFGAYLILDQWIYAESDDQGLGFFLQLGSAVGDRNEIDFYVGVGVRYIGLFPGRDADEIGLALARAAVSDRLPDRTSAETVVEFTYRAQITPWLAIQPDVQLVVDPGADPSLDEALVAGIRFEVGF